MFLIYFITVVVNSNYNVFRLRMYDLPKFLLPVRGRAEIQIQV